jgi:hypothetical protein
MLSWTNWSATPAVYRSQFQVSRKYRASRNNAGVMIDPRERVTDDLHVFKSLCAAIDPVL